jgi:hypothetical protein
MDAAIRERVGRRAGSRCEYCGIRESDDPVMRFHVEHIRARKHGGTNELSNLAGLQLLQFAQGPELIGC